MQDALIRHLRLMSLRLMRKRAFTVAAGKARARAGRPARPVLAAAAGLAVIAAAFAAPAAAATAATAATAGATAAAAAGPAYWVSPNGVSTGKDTGCSTAAYSTIQSAVTAAEAAKTAHGPVPTIELCPGTYAEQLTITRSLTLVRASVPASQGPVVIQLPAAAGTSQSAPYLSTTSCQAKDAATSTQVPESVIEICAAKAGGINTSGVSVSISHVTVQGNWPNSVCYDSLYGILAEGGATVSLTDSVVEQIGAYPLNGCQGGVGVEAGFSPTGQVGHAILINDTIESYQKNGVTIDGPGSSAKISGVTVTGDGPTAQIAQNGIQVSFGATAVVIRSTITGNNYTGTGEASATGILVAGGGGSVCGIGAGSPLVRNASFTHNTLINNDIGIALFNVNAACDQSAGTPTRDLACYNTISNDHGYAGGPSADANISGLVTQKYGAIGDQAGVSDSGFKDVICDNAISGVGYASRDSRKSLPNPKPPAWVRPVDIFSFARAFDPVVHGNTYDGKPYVPH
jgi:hypothetical protein